jgi:hypothetical protein
MYWKPIELLGHPKAYIPKQKIEIYLYGMVTKVEKSYRIYIWLKPKYN